LFKELCLKILGNLLGVLQNTFFKLVLHKEKVEKHCPVTPPVEIHRSFGGAYCFHLQDREVNQARNQHEAGCKYSFSCRLHLAGLLLGLHFGPEDGGCMFRNVSGLYRTTLGYIREDITLQNHGCKNIKFNIRETNF
jgi:hypothetical protein